MSSETSLRSQLELPNDQQIDVLAAILDNENEQATSARSMSTEPQEVLEKHPGITPFKDLVSKASEIVLARNGNEIAQYLRSILENKNDYLNHRDEAVSLSIALNISQYIAPRFRALPPSPK
ncbi:TPA: hypothetical protein ACTXE5_004900, partial [Raoultella ornithinolytica]